MKVIRLEVGLLACNAYLVWDERAADGVVIDPGDEGERIVRRCRAEGFAPTSVVDTHAHVDHVGANAPLKAAFPEALLCVGSADAATLSDPAANLSSMFGGGLVTPAPDRELNEGDEVRFGSCVLRVLTTPGHTPGGICLLADATSPAQLFCGDLVFRDGVGRVDFPGGSGVQLLESIRRKVLTLPDETVLWPGHGEPTTVGRERAHNPFLQSQSPAGF